jgi:WxcM-like, C-terminal.
LNILKN